MEPVYLEVVRVCAFKAKPLTCRACHAERKRKDKAEPCANCGSTLKPVQRHGCARCEKAKGDHDHYGAPESFNVSAGRDPNVYRAAIDRWIAILTPLLEESGLPRRVGRIVAEGEATFDHDRERDQGNFRVILEKALGDALEAGGWLESDRWERYEFGGLAYAVEPGVSRTRLVLFPTPADDPEPLPLEGASVVYDEATPLDLFAPVKSSPPGV